MRTLVENIRGIVAEGPVDKLRITRIEAAVKAAVPRLMDARVCENPPNPGRYLCYRDADYGFVVMVLVWGKGDGTPIHDHGTWGVEAILKDAVRVTQYTECERDPKPLDSMVCEAGMVISNMPPSRDVHKVEHARGEPAITLHVYGREMTGNRMFVPGEGYKSCKLDACDLNLSELETCGKARTGRGAKSPASVGYPK